MRNAHSIVKSQFRHSNFVGNRFCSSTCVPSSFVLVVVCVGCRCSYPCKRRPTGKVVGCVCVGCGCVCDANSMGRGNQRGAAMREVEAGHLLGGGTM